MIPEATNHHPARSPPPSPMRATNYLIDSWACGQKPVWVIGAERVNQIKTTHTTKPIKMPRFNCQIRNPLGSPPSWGICTIAQQTLLCCPPLLVCSTSSCFDTLWPRTGARKEKKSCNTYIWHFYIFLLLFLYQFQSSLAVHLCLKFGLHLIWLYRNHVLHSYFVFRIWSFPHLESWGINLLFVCFCWLLPIADDSYMFGDFFPKLRVPIWLKWTWNLECRNRSCFPSRELLSHYLPEAGEITLLGYDDLG